MALDGIVLFCFINFLTSLSSKPFPTLYWISILSRSSVENSSTPSGGVKKGERLLMVCGLGILKIKPLDRAVQSPTSTSIIPVWNFCLMRRRITVPVFSWTIFTEVSDGFPGVETPSVEAVRMVFLIVSSSFPHPEHDFASSFFFVFNSSLNSAVFDASAIDLWILLDSSWTAVELVAMSATDWIRAAIVGSTLLFLARSLIFSLSTKDSSD